MTINGNLATQRNWLIKVAGIDGYFETFTGGERSSETIQNYDGGARYPDIVAGPATTANIVVSRKFKRGRDDALLKRLRPAVGYFRATVSRQAIDGNFLVAGAPLTYAQALLVRVSEPEADSNSSDASSFELEFAVSSAV